MPLTTVSVVLRFLKSSHKTLDVPHCGTAQLNIGGNGGAAVVVVGAAVDVVGAAVEVVGAVVVGAAVVGADVVGATVVGAKVVPAKMVILKHLP